MKVFGGWGGVCTPIPVSEISLRKNLTTTMEAELPIAAMECLYRSPTLYWAMASALALCWGTGLLSSKSKTKNPASRLTVLRKKTSGILRMVAEEALYAFMACVNMAMGVFFWILDFYHEGRPPPNANYFPVANQLAKVKEPDLKNPSPSSSEEEEGEMETRSDRPKPRRAGIIRPRKVKGDTCGCWGYEVQDIQTCENDDGLTAPSSLQQVRKLRVLMIWFLGKFPVMMQFLSQFLVLCWSFLELFAPRTKTAPSVNLGYACLFAL